MDILLKIREVGVNEFLDLKVKSEKPRVCINCIMARLCPKNMKLSFEKQVFTQLSSGSQSWYISM